MNRLICSVALLLLSQTATQAAFVTFTSRSEWESQLQRSIFVETFDAFDGISYNSTPLVTPNFTIEAFTDSANNRIENAGPDAPQMSAFLDFDGNPVRLSFEAPLSAWGADMRVSGGTFVGVRSGGLEIAAFEPNTSSSAGAVRFFGVIATGGTSIEEIDFRRVGSGSTQTFDNISISAVPEPTSVGTLLSLLGVSIVFRRRTRSTVI
ncbi:MAG: hypothetical protein AAF802_26225 [Planctomycetota bacterium]